MTKIITRLLLLLTLCFFSSALLAQDKKFDSLLAVFQTAKEDTGKVNILNKLSESLRAARKNDEAKRYNDTALALAKKVNFTRGQAYAYNGIGLSFYNQSKYSEALKNFLLALELHEGIGNKRGMAAVYQYIGLVYHSQRNYPEALKNFLAAVKVTEALGDKANMALMLSSAEKAYWMMHDYAKMLETNNVVLKLGEELGDKKIIAWAYSGLGRYYNAMGNYPEALKWYLAALKITEELGEKSNVDNLYHNIGTIYSLMKNYEEALKYHRVALKIREDNGSRYGTAISLMVIGEIQRRQNNHAEALENFKSALELREAIEDTRVADIFRRIGSTHTDLGNIAEALRNYEEAQKIFRAAGNKSGVGNIYLSLGELSIRLNDPAEAKRYLDSGLLLLKDNNHRAGWKFYYLSRLDSLQGNFKSALENYQLYKLYIDSIFNETNSKQIAQMKEQYESEKKDKEIVLLTSAKEKLEAEQKITALLIERKQDSLNMAQSETERVRLANEKMQAENRFKQQQIELLAYEKQLQQLQIEKDGADLALQKADAGKKQEALALLSKEKALLSKEKTIQSLELQKQKEARNYFIAGLVLLALLSFFIFRNYQHQRKASRLAAMLAKKQMQELELQSLRAQLNPHFMFNSLNAIQELILMQENEKSHTYLARFAKLLSMLLENTESSFVTLNKELDFLQLYLSLEKLRIPNLEYDIRVDASVNASDTQIPNMVLQPYIENALWHGLSHKEGDRRLELNVSRQNGSVVYNISDNGVGRKKANEMKSLFRKEHKSKGMELLQKRFKLLNEEYGSEITTEMSDILDRGEVAGTKVQIKVPVTLTGHLQNAMAN